ncbi:MAG: molecular chaperone TorD family protein [Pseudomonadota bacterium]
MSVAALTRPPLADPAARARAKQTLWRLAAVALAHPAPELHAAIASGKFHEALARAWGDVTGRAWPRPSSPGAYPAFEAGYIAAFLHGPSGKPLASLLAGDHEGLLQGLSRPVFMLNVAAFYGHFGLKAAVEDEGRADEPDHLAAMAEFMAVLCHLEAGACGRGRDPDPARRAQRDFLARYLAPMLDCVTEKLRRATLPDLDPTMSQLLAEFAPWAHQQIAELEARVGPFRDPDAPRPETKADAPQDLWG